MQTWMWGLSVVAHLAAHGAATPAELSSELGVNRATTYRVLEQLEREGWVIATGKPRRYEAAFRVVATAAQLLKRNRVRAVTLPYASELAEMTGEAVHVAFYQPGGFVIGTDRSEPGPRGSITSIIGQTQPATATAAGKVLLAHQTEAEVERVLSAPMVAVTPWTITDPEAMRRELTETLQRGFGAVDRETHPRTWGLAVPVFDERENVPVALGMPLAGAFDERRAAELVPVAIRVAARASAALGLVSDAAPLI